MQLNLLPNTDTAKLLANVWANREAAPWICSSPVHEGEALLVGTGPSLLDSIEIIRAYVQNGAVVFALNNAGKILGEHGIASQYQVVLDARPDNIKFLGRATTYLLGSQCDPSLFAEVSGKALQWHAYMDGIDELFPEAPLTLIGGGTTVGLSCMALCYAMGYRRLHLFGYDSSFRGESMHAVPQTRTDQERVSFDVTVNDRVFSTNAAMAKQAEIFPQFSQSLADLDVIIKVYGDGLLPFIAHISNHLEPEHACV